MKKIVVLGGGRNQVPLINTAKELGYCVVLCDFRDNVEGVGLSDIHYQINTLNYDEVVEVCRREKPDGIISNSEPAMPIVAAITEEFNFVGNSLASIRSLMFKDCFRAMQKKIGCFLPAYSVLSRVDEVWDVVSRLHFPIIIKPAQCSGSRGSKRIIEFDKDVISSVCKDCFHYTTNGKVVVEEFVDMPTLTTIEGDVFIHKGKIIYDGLFSTTRAVWAPMVPMTYTAPVVINKTQLDKLYVVLRKLFTSAGITHGEYNVEGYFTKDDDCFIIEINVRQGGHEIPLLIKDFTGIDFNKLLVSTSVGDDSYWKEVVGVKPNCRSIIKQTVFSQYDGKYDGLLIDPLVDGHIYRTFEFVKRGDVIKQCVDGTSIVAIVDMEYQSREEQLFVYDKMNELISVKTK